MENDKKSLGRAFYRVLERLRPAKTTLRRFKSFFIVAFAVLAIYQTSQLWFLHLANRNFFLYLSDRWDTSVADGYREFVRPMRVVYGDGTGRFDISYSGLLHQRPRDYFDTILTQLFTTRINFVGESETDYVRLLSRPMLKFEYGFSMPGSIFPLGFGQRTGAVLTSRGIAEFTSVVIWLPYNDYENKHVFFIDGERTWEFVMESVGADAFPIIPVPTSPLHFVSAALEEREDFLPCTFIAQHGVRRLAVYPVVGVNPYIPPIGGTLPFVRNQVAHFFNNPATINARIAGDGVWTFSNVHTTVRFHTEVLEYASFRPSRQNFASTFIRDFSTALAFVDNDPHVTNEIFLMGYESRGTSYVFWFGYILDNFPVLMPEGGWQVTSELDILPAPIEVVVAQGRVVNYRRLTHNFHLADSHIWLELNLDAFLATQDGPVNGLALGHQMHGSWGNLRLGWRALYTPVEIEDLEEAPPEVE